MTIILYGGGVGEVVQVVPDDEPRFDLLEQRIRRYSASDGTNA